MDGDARRERERERERERSYLDERSSAFAPRD